MDGWMERWMDLGGWNEMLTSSSFLLMFLLLLVSVAAVAVKVVMNGWMDGWTPVDGVDCCPLRNEYGMVLYFPIGELVRLFNKEA